MKRVGLYTITDYVNYGNRLQNYAGQEILRSFGFEVETIRNFPTKPVEKGFAFTLYRIKNALTQSPMILINKAYQKIVDRKKRALYLSCQRAKEVSFRAFSEKYMSESDFVMTLSNVPTDLDRRYDYCVVGSDQIWNPNIRYGSALDFLSFVSPHKRIALAPSIGVSLIPEQYQEHYRSYLSEMACVSVREDKGAEIIEALCGRKAPVLVDPTLVLTTKEWLKIAKKAAKKPDKKYLLTYFIGEVSRHRLSILRCMAADNHLELVMLNSLSDTARYDADPAEFIDYIHGADLVCTDSFHCIIFSMHFDRPFVVFDREGKSAPMSSRIDTLLHKFHFENRKQTLLEQSNQYYNVDFAHVDAIMNSERHKVIEYLKKALDLNQV
ncbi:MAG: hypothetical protein AUK44_03800 [Porphyromonadaceae bacterium CG2_30_38_12]|nr:MAG: hypothetical protein AUK44_03800 [Porphyromonadaceae bacterium CG2_30_38_12]